MVQNIKETVGQVVLRAAFEFGSERHCCWVEVSASDTHVTGIKIDTQGGYLEKLGAAPASGRLGASCERVLAAYFADPAQAISMPLHEHGDSPNQRAAMRFLQQIPCGQTRSYAQQARYVSRRNSNGFNARNAGTANHGNHYPLAIPCHRIVRTDSTLGGFMGSSARDALALKEALLQHEQTAVVASQRRRASAQPAMRG